MIRRLAILILIYASEYYMYHIADSIIYAISLLLARNIPLKGFAYLY